MNNYEVIINKLAYNMYKVDIKDNKKNISLCKILEYESDEFKKLNNNPSDEYIESII